MTDPTSGPRKNRDPENPPQPASVPEKSGYSGGRHTGVVKFTQTAVTTTAPIQLARNDRRFPVAYLWADRTNTDYVIFGDPGLIAGAGPDLNAGDVVPLFDVAPSDIYLIANSGTQKVHFIGHGDPDAPVTARTVAGGERVK